MMPNDLETLTLNAVQHENQFVNLDALARIPSLRSLAITGSSEYQNILAFPHLPQLRKLFLDGVRLESWEPIWNMKQLTDVTLRRD